MKMLMEWASDPIMLMFLALFGVLILFIASFLIGISKKMKKVNKIETYIKMIYAYKNYNYVNEINSSGYFDYTYKTMEEFKNDIAVYEKELSEDYVGRDVIKTFKDDYLNYNKNGRYIDASDLFNYRKLFITSGDEGFIRTIINTFTGIGLLGTVVGLCTSLNGFSPDAIEASVDGIIAGLAPAMGTTIIGLILSLIFSTIFSMMSLFAKNKANDLSDIMMSLFPCTNPLFTWDAYYSKAMDEYSNSLDKIVKQFTNSMKKNLNEDYENYSNTISNATNSISSATSQYNLFINELNSIKDAMSVWVNSVNKNINDSTKNVADSQIRYANSIETINASLIESIEKINEYRTKLQAENNNSLDELDEKLKAINTATEALSTYAISVKDTNKEFMDKMMNTPENVSEAIVNSLIDKVSEVKEMLEKAKEQ